MRIVLRSPRMTIARAVTVAAKHVVLRSEQSVSGHFRYDPRAGRAVWVPNYRRYENPDDLTAPPEYDATRLLPGKTDV